MNAFLAAVSFRTRILVPGNSNTDSHSLSKSIAFQDCFSDPCASFTFRIDAVYEEYQPFIL